MRRNRHAPWRKRKSNAETDPAAVFQELRRRQLADLDDCRLAWEREADPLAVCVAITKCDLPEWLTDALLVLLTDEQLERPVLKLRRRWAKRGRDAADAARAEVFAALRGGYAGIPLARLEVARVAANRIVRERYTDVEELGEDAIKAIYSRVCRRLRDPGRYYHAPEGFADRVQRARVALLRLIEGDLARQRE